MTAAFLVRGDARRLPLATGSVQAIVTSPPYFGLRQYSTNPVIWGGDPNCTHSLEDGPSTKPMTGGTGESSGKQLRNVGSQFGNAWATVHPPGHRSSDTKPGPLQGPGNTNRERFGSAICIRCGAWAGELGSEPHVEMFIRHLVEVFAEAKRVLRDDGVCFVNIGSSLASGIIESEDYVLREDLTDAERAYVYAELAKHYAAQSQAVPVVQSADEPAEQEVSGVPSGADTAARELPGEGM